MRKQILDKKNMYNDKRGQVMIINMVMLVMAIVVFVGILPVIRDSIETTRDQATLNCKSNINKCNVNSAAPCYNSSIRTETVGCAMIDLYIPYIVIIVLIAGVAKLISNRVELGFGQQQQPYPGY